MKRILFAIAIATFSFGTAQAAESAGGSEFFFQSAPGVSDVTAGIGFANAKTRPDGGTADTKQNAFALAAGYEYGINDMLAAGIGLVYMNSKQDGSPDLKSSGLANPTVYLRGVSPMGAARLRFGADLGISLADKKAATASEDGNVSTGGFSLTPYVGFDTDAGGGIFGARLSYGLNFERSYEGTSTTTTGGNELGLAAFYEFLSADMLFGGEFHYTAIGDTTDKTAAGDVKNDDNTSPMGVALYARIPAAPTIVVLPRLDYDFSAGSKYDTYSVITGTLAARFSF